MYILLVPFLWRILIQSSTSAPLTSLPPPHGANSLPSFPCTLVSPCVLVLASATRASLQISTLGQATNLHPLL